MVKWADQCDVDAGQRLVHDRMQGLSAPQIVGFAVVPPPLAWVAVKNANVVVEQLYRVQYLIDFSVCKSVVFAADGSIDS